jgi:hypothetical protein
LKSLFSGETSNRAGIFYLLKTMPKESRPLSCRALPTFAVATGRGGKLFDVGK